MKFFKVFSFVVIGHVLLIGAFFLQSGCQSIDRQWEEHRREKQNVTVPREVLAQEQGLPADSDQIDPSFNNGMTGASSGTRPRAQPTRPAATNQSQPSLFETESPESLFNPGLADGFNSGAEPFEPSPTSGYMPYTVQSGDTLWGLSKEYNVSFASLLEANGLNRDSQLKIGQEIMVPSGYGDMEMVEVDVEETAVVAGTTIYEVRRGDTLSEIAVRAGTSVSRIKTLNNMSSDRIRIGQRLIVPGEVIVTEETEAIMAVEVDPSAYTAVHEVMSGETASGIANRYGMSVPELLAANGIDNPRNLRAGSELKVKPAASRSKLSNTPGSTSATSLLPNRASNPSASGNLPPPIVGPSEDGPTAPEIIPESGAQPVAPEVIDDEGFGDEIFGEFDVIEEVEVERRGSDGG